MFFENSQLGAEKIHKVSAYAPCPNMVLLGWANLKIRAIFFEHEVHPPGAHSLALDSKTQLLGFLDSVWLELSW